MENNDIRDYKYKMDKVERYFSFITLIVFLLTFKGTLGFIIFMVFAAIVFAYYFIFYKKRPLYFSINGEEITASQGLLFKLELFKIFDLDTVRKLENRIELVLKDGKKIILLKILLSDNDYNEIYNELIQRISGKLND